MGRNRILITVIPHETNSFFLPVPVCQLSSLSFSQMIRLRSSFSVDSSSISSWPSSIYSTTSTSSSPSCRKIGGSSVQFPDAVRNCRSSVGLVVGKGRRRRCRIGREDCLVGNGYGFSCKASVGDSAQQWDERDQFLQASLMVRETVMHYYLRKRGFIDEIKWQSSGKLHPLSLPMKDSKSAFNPFGHGFLRRFHSPTIFLKVSCEGDLILPIVVGDSAIERLILTLRDDQSEGTQNQFQFLKNLVGILGYEIKKVWISKRVINTYYAQIFLGKNTEVESISFDSRPSDAIHMASEFKAPIYVSKEIVLKDAIRITHGTRRKEAFKAVYDVFLDSAIEGPNLLAKEIDLVTKMNTAIQEERYKDAANLRDELIKLRKRRTEF